MAEDVKTFNGLAWGSVNSFGGLARASVKAFNGIDTTAGGFVPTDIAGCVLWLDASQIVGLSDGDPVVTWADESGNGADATAVTASGGTVTFETNELNALPGVLFAGAVAYITGDHGALSEYSIFVVARINPASADQRLYGNSVNALLGSNGSKWQAYTGSFIDSGISTSSSAVMLGLTAGVGRVLTVNEAATTDGTTAGGLNGTYLNCYIGAAEFTNGYLFEMIVYDSKLGTTDRQTVEAYLKAKWGTP